ncbi:MAG: CFAP97 domain-containing protein [Proteobacteria bacterium]|nr:CFAP97 domain-containing protein [Pseudomonadota bacterium]
MITRFPGMADLLEKMRVAVREGLEIPTVLPWWSRLPIIRGFTQREVQRIVRENEVLVQRLRNFDRVRTPLPIPVDEFIPGDRQMISATVTLVTPDGRVVVSRVLFPYGQPFDESEFYRRLSSDIGDATFKGDPLLTTKVKRAIIGIDYYVQTYRKI